MMLVDTWNGMNLLPPVGKGVVKAVRRSIRRRLSRVEHMKPQYKVTSQKLVHQRKPHKVKAYVDPKNGQLPVEIKHADRSAVHTSAVLQHGFGRIGRRPRH